MEKRESLAVIYEKDESKDLPFTSLASVLIATNKDRRMLLFVKRSFTCLTKRAFASPLLLRPLLEFGIHNLERIYRAAMRLVKGHRELQERDSGSS